MDDSTQPSTPSDMPSQPVAPSTQPRKSRKTTYIAVAAVAIVAVLVIAVVAISGLLGSQAYEPKDGDYIEYTIDGSVSSSSSPLSISGTARAVISNVTDDGYNITITYDVDGLDLPTTTLYVASDGILGTEEDYGEKIGSEIISTNWGQKNVDKYRSQEDGTNTTYYIGTNPEVVYKLEMTSLVSGVEISMSMVLSDTNIDMVKEKNKA